MSSNKDKSFLTYNQQMRKLRNDKKIECKNTKHKNILIRSGYFNLINGYKTPFVSYKDEKGNHIYYPGTDLGQIDKLKQMDEDLRLLLLRYINKVEVEVRTLTGYKFDQMNDNGKVSWYEAKAYASDGRLKDKMLTISSVYYQLNRSQAKYVKFYVENHEQIPTWIAMKAVKFSTFINILNNSKPGVKHALCKLYGMFDNKDKPNVKLLIGSLHWLRTVRNACAHNERVYCVSSTLENETLGEGVLDQGTQCRNKKKNSRIIVPYFDSLPPSYKRDKEKNLFDLLIYFKYFLPPKEFSILIGALEAILSELQRTVIPSAFNRIRAQMGIKDLSILEMLVHLPKADIQYNKFEKF